MQSCLISLHSPLPGTLWAAGAQGSKACHCWPSGGGGGGGPTKAFLPGLGPSVPNAILKYLSSDS